MRPRGSAPLCLMLWQQAVSAAQGRAACQRLHRAAAFICCIWVTLTQKAQRLGSVSGEARLCSAALCRQAGRRELRHSLALVNKSTQLGAPAQPSLLPAPPATACFPGPARSVLLFSLQAASTVGCYTEVLSGSDVGLSRSGLAARVEPRAKCPPTHLNHL